MARTVGRIDGIQDVPAMQSLETVAIHRPMTPLRMIVGNDRVDYLFSGDRQTPFGETPLDICEHFRFDVPHGRCQLTFKLSEG